ncbi:MAG TPA: SDR family NAD(P)-dependent oxidoreductase, partial [Candidatus Binatus sp.]|nr:SDR family NAD(P)-dependent oxidoreductase [Candidatus Binatus sp.]
MDLGLTGKVAMVTGASRGLGRAMAHALADEGMYVSVCARTQQTLTEAVSALTLAKPEPPRAMGFVGDITKPENAQRWVDETVAKFGGIDVLVNNAGAARPGPLAELPDSAWQEQFDLNLFAPVRLARLCATQMEKRSGGSIINIGSIYGRESG